MKTVTLILADECDEVVSLTTFGTSKKDGYPRICTGAFKVNHGDVVHFPDVVTEQKDGKHEH